MSFFSNFFDISEIVVYLRQDNILKIGVSHRKSAETGGLSFFILIAMIFYHGTTKKNWKAIQKEKILFGRRFLIDEKTRKNIREFNRCTYLAIDKDEARKYGKVLLQVEYDPFKKGAKNNYTEDCWQMRVYEPIPLENIKVAEIRFNQKRK